MSFQDTLASRSAAVYADFLIPHLTENTRLLDCGCGSGSITVGLAASVRRAVGLDLSAAAFKPAISHLVAKSVRNVFFVAGNGAWLPFPEESKRLANPVFRSALARATMLREEELARWGASDRAC
jgi:ubiquinone/menaquinone biosynthesis C-methylase UbiE